MFDPLNPIVAAEKERNLVIIFLLVVVPLIILAAKTGLMKIFARYNLSGPVFRYAYYPKEDKIVRKVYKIFYTLLLIIISIGIILSLVTRLLEK